MRRKKAQEQDASATDGARITPEEVQKVEFRLAFRGYNERDVDAFLDRITEDLSSYVEENARQRGGTGAVAAPDPPNAQAEAERILAGAREEAAAIVRRAEEQAAGIRTAAGGGSADARGAVAPFLNKEREFLQSLGSLVQTHAEEIKQMVMVIRERAQAQAQGPSHAPAQESAAALPHAPAQEPAAVAMPATGSETPEAADPEPGAFEPASAAEIRERLEAADPRDEVIVTDDASDEASEADPVVVESGTEPVFSTEGSPAAERRERSLRELFWGED